MADCRNSGARNDLRLRSGLARSDPDAESDARPNEQVPAKGLSLALDRQIGMSVTALEALATSPQFQAGDFVSFRAQVDRYLSSHPGWIVVINSTGQQRLNTVVPPGATLPHTVNRDLLRKVFAAKDVYVSDAISGTVLKQLIVVISVHVPIASADLVMSYMMPLGALTRLLQEQELPKDWVGVVADRDRYDPRSHANARNDRQANDHSRRRAWQRGQNRVPRRHPGIFRVDDVGPVRMVNGRGGAGVADQRHVVSKVWLPECRRYCRSAAGGGVWRVVQPPCHPAIDLARRRRGRQRGAGQQAAGSRNRRAGVGHARHGVSNQTRGIGGRRRSA